MTSPTKTQAEATEHIFTMQESTDDIVGLREQIKDNAAVVFSKVNNSPHAFKIPIRTVYTSSGCLVQALLTCEHYGKVEILAAGRPDRHLPKALAHLCHLLSEETSGCLLDLNNGNSEALHAMESDWMYETFVASRLA